MSVLVDQDTRIVIQGITGRQGRYHAGRLLAGGFRVSAGVSPGKGGRQVEGIPVYDSVSQALTRHPEINASLILTPPAAVLSAALEAIQAGIPLLAVIAEFVPVLDSLRYVTAAREAGATVVGPNSIGVISPGKGKLGIMPEYIYKPGRIGILSRSGTMTHEMASDLSFAGFGQSTCIGLGGDPVCGLDHTEGLELLRGDPDTDVVVLIGEIGGAGEENAARYIRQTHYPKPVFAYIAGARAPEGKKMGHAGAIVSGNTGTVRTKIEALTRAGVPVAHTMGGLVELIREENVRLGGRLLTVEPAAGLLEERAHEG